MQNILDNPKDPKYRSINTETDLYKNKLKHLIGPANILNALGFVSLEVKLVLADGYNSGLIQQAVDKIVVCLSKVKTDSVLPKYTPLSRASLFSNYKPEEFRENIFDFPEIETHCAHGRPNWRSCPWCTGRNAAARENADAADAARTAVFEFDFDFRPPQQVFLNL